MLRFILVLSLIAAPLFAAEDYELVMHRKCTVGQRFALTGKAAIENVTTISANNRLVKEDKLTATCTVAGEVEILALTANGKIASMKLKVARCEGKENGEAAEIFKAGDVIESKNDGVKRAVLVNGGKATLTQMELATTLLPVGKEGSATDDEIFGPARKIKVGDEWPLNGAVAAKDAVGAGLTGIKPEDITGTAKLREISEKDGQKCLHVILLMSMKGSGMALPEAPPQIKVKTMDFQLYGDGHFPVDAGSLSYNDKVAQTMDLSAGGDLEEGGEKVKLDSSTHRKVAHELELKTLK